MRVLKQSVARDVVVFMTLASDHVTGATGLTLTITSSKAGAAFASITPTVTELSNGWYKLAFTTSHTDTLGDLALHITGTLADPTDLLIQIVAYDPFDAVRLGLTALPNVASGSAGAIPTTGTGSNQITLASGQVTVATNNDKTGYTASTVSDKTGYSLTQTFPVNFSSLSINGSGHVTLADGSIVTAKLGTFVLAKTTNITGFNDIAASAILATPGNLLATDSLGRVTAGANADKSGYSLTPTEEAAIAGSVWDVLTASHQTTGTMGKALTSAASAGDPWATNIPGAYSSGTAGYIVGTNLDATVGSRMATFTLPTNFSTLAINGSGHITLADGSLVTAKLGTFALAKTTNITGFNDIASTAIVSGGAINTASGKISEVILTDTVTTYTGNTPQTGDSFALLGTPANGTIAADIAAGGNVYHADIEFTVDAAASTDRYTAVWFKNGIRQTAVTAGTLQVVRRSDGSNLIASTAMTQIASTGAWKYDAVSTQRIIAGQDYLAIASATIDAEPQSFARNITRDSI